MSGFGRKADVHVGQFCEKFGVALGMSAFPESGRSDTPKSGKTKVRFRPKPVVRRLLLSQCSKLLIRTSEIRDVMERLASERFGCLNCLIAVLSENNNTRIVIFHG